MPTLTGVVLTEIVGRDVVSWRVTPDAFHELTYSVDTADVPGVVVLDGQGRIEDALVIHYAPANKTIVQFKTRSDFYALLYRRNNFIEESDGSTPTTTPGATRGIASTIGSSPPRRSSTLCRLPP